MQPAAEPTGDQPVEDQQHIPAPRSAPAAEPSPLTAGPSSPTVGSSPLTDRELEILAFEGKWWKHAGAKEQAIRDTFGLSSTRYYQLLNGLLDNPAALEKEPVLVGRLRRLRSARARTRRR
ncbi:DUF3263 domain-containing protein [Actinoplanes philippinensis]|uniref:DUF3263 domain-containing protein n=1 Tax=Actinoplanes philippinensis TaxID=35752 RepID=UPI003F4D40F4